MAGLNQCNFIGRVGKIDSRFMPNGDAVTNLSLAVDESYKDKNGNKVDKVEWVNVTIYKKLAEIATQYVSKGSSLFVSGKLSTRKYTDKNGIEKYVTEVIANSMQMLGDKSSNTESKPAKQATPAGNGFDEFDSDIPF